MAWDSSKNRLEYTFNIHTKKGLTVAKWHQERRPGPGPEPGRPKVLRQG
jgi:hypothetical protein